MAVADFVSRLGAIVYAGGRFVSTAAALSVVYVPGPGSGVFDSNVLPRPVMLNAGAARLPPSFASPSTGGIEYVFGAGKYTVKRYRFVLINTVSLNVCF